MDSLPFGGGDRDALLRPRDSIAIQPIRYEQPQPQPTTHWLHPWCNAGSSSSSSRTADVNESAAAVAAVWSTSEPVVDPRVERRATPPPQTDLIELVSSTDNVSICGSTSSAEYRSCVEEDFCEKDAADEDADADAEATASATVELLSAEEKTRCGGGSSSTMATADVVPRVVVDEHGLVDCIEEGRCCLLASTDVGPPFVKRLPQCPSSAQLSVASSNSDPMIPTCRICHLAGGTSAAGSDDRDNGLISPCRCSGTMQYIHSACLMKWLEVSSRKSKRPPSCELCLFQYHRHKKFKSDHWKFPKCTLRDKILHMLFFLSLIMMIGSATVTILCFKHDKALSHRTSITPLSSSTASMGAGGANVMAGFDRNRLTHSEIVTLVCGVLFFVAFFLAMYVEVKSRCTVYKLITDFLYLNQQWYIDEYDKKMDIQAMEV